MTDEIARFFDAYAEAFSRGDVDAVCGLWAYPAFFVARGRRAALDAAAFRANTEAILAAYRRFGAVRAEKRLLAADALFDGLWLVRTADRMIDAMGAEVAAWEHRYLLSRTEDGLRAVCAMPDGELDAWAARGTPLGSW
jgi:ketosteroid isomerase-like protein